MDWTASEFRRHALGLGVRELPVDGEIAIFSVELFGVSADPADRIIVASAIINRAKLFTADEGILSSRTSFGRWNAEE